MNLTPTDSVMQFFHDAGWQRGQIADSDRTLHPAVYILEQFRGLHVVPPDSDGVTVPSDIEFRRLSELGDLRHRPIESITTISSWSKLLGSPLVCIAEYHHSHGAISIAGDGRLFVRSLVHDAMGFQANTFAEGIEQILLGTRQSTPMIRPDQDSMTWHGITYTHGDAELYNYT